jgi:cytochrome c
MKISNLLSLGVIALSVLLVSCGGNSNSSNTTSESATTTSSTEAPKSLEDMHKDNPLYVKGLAKVQSSDCVGCHMVERKVVGPSYAEVAAKYESTEENVKMLAARVINGHVGSWGEVQMPAHPTLSQEDAEDMIRYILLLKR